MEKLLFPRLSAEDAGRIRTKLRKATAPFFDRAEFDEALESSNAFPATGGRRVRHDELLKLRDDCCAARTLTTSSFDLEVGRALYEASRGSIGEFGNPGVWDFLTLVLLPDIANQRFGTSSAARVTGGHRRHVFQRLWRRWNVFGSEIVESGFLTEDDYQALLERTLTSQDRLLARCAVNAIRSSGRSGQARREFTRVFMRQLVQLSGLVELSGCTDEERHAIVSEAARRTEAQFKS